MKKVHIISHTHWDREWYLNSKFVNRWIPAFFDNLFSMLEKEPEYRFILDGQTSIIDDCCTELQPKGQEKVDEFIEKLNKYVQEGRIIIGPYYLQPDWQLISDEALVRNMIYGREISKKFGGGSNTGWLLDNFSQISQTSQIHAQFGMKGIVVWRGVEFPPEQIKSEFYWESPDGTRLPSVYLLSSYRNAMRLATYPENIYGRIISEAEKIESFAQTDNLLLMNGYDQEMEPDDILPYIKNRQADTEKFQVVQSIPAEYMESVIEGLQGKEIPTLKNALYSGRYISVFPGILSCRMYLKTKNDALQRQLEQVAEPIGVMNILTGGEYPSEQLDTTWKLLLKNHPHDSICGVSVDDVHTDMETRFAQVEEKGEQCIDETVQNLSAVIDTSAFSEADSVFHVFNTTLKKQTQQVQLPISGETGVMVRDANGREYPWQKSGDSIIVEAELPAFGWNTFGIYQGEAQKEVVAKETFPVMENVYMRVEFHKNGTFCITDKISGKVYENLGYLEDCADSGDEYNYSYMKDDVPITTQEETPEISVVESGDLRTVVKIEYLWKLPKELMENRAERSKEKETVPVIVYVTLEKDSQILRFRTQIRNRCKDHRIRVMFPTGLQTKYSYAQTQFDITKHEIFPVSFDDSEMPEHVKRIVVGARESEPITQFPQRDFTAITNGKYGVAVLNRGLPEYEVLPEATTIALTLFRGVSWLARTDLNTRIGDAGPTIYTPDAQCLRDMEFHYGISLFEGDVQDAALMERSGRMNGLYPVVQTTVHTGTFPSEHSMVTLETQGDVRVTAIKQAQDGNGMIIRLFHVGKQDENVRLIFEDSVTGVYRTNLAEEDQEEIAVKDSAAELIVPSRQITSLRILTNVERTKRNPLQEAVNCRVQDEPIQAEMYEIPWSVSEKDIEEEEIRAQKTEQEYAEAKTAFEQVEEDRNPIFLKFQMEVKHRTALEARLSVIFTKKKYQELMYGKDSKAYQEAVAKADPQIQELADALNVTRVERRGAEYWVDYYQQQEKKN